ncbi:MAG: membrane protein [Nitrospirales bacterium]|nr:MAG: membrane protein [Nitrospirales bacterium]
MKYPVLVLLIMGMLTGSGYALTPAEQKGLDIALETERRDKGFENYEAKGRMILQSPNGEIAEREFTMYTLEVEDDGDKRVVRFVEPRDLAGMVSLTYSHGLEPDDQWLYLPALRRTKRLAARDKTGSFAGSEFAFEDIGTWEVKKYRYEYLQDDDLDGIATFKVKNIPAYPYSGYSHMFEWVDQKIYQPRRLLYHDVAGRPLKELRFYDYRQFLGQYWRPMKTVMTNLQTGAQSTIEWSEYKFRTSVQEHRFNSNVLRRWSN